MSRTCGGTRLAFKKVAEWTSQVTLCGKSSDHLIWVCFGVCFCFVFFTAGFMQEPELTNERTKNSRIERNKNMSGHDRKTAG